MSKYVLSPLIYTISGKLLPGYVIMKNHRLRRIKQPSGNFNSKSKLLLTMSRFSHAAKNWKLLDIPTKEQWISAATTITLYNNLGQPFNPSGYQLFIACNINLLGILSGYFTVPGQFYNIQLPQSVVSNPIISSSQFMVSNPVLANANQYLKIYATLPSSNPINFNNATWYQLIALPSSTTFPYNLYSLFSLYFGAYPVVNTFIGIKLVVVDKSNGLASKPMYFQVIPTA